MISEPLPDCGSAPSRRSKADETMRAFQLELLSKVITRFVKNIDGRVPDDTDLEHESMHCIFSATPLTVFRHQGFEFCNYFVWRGTHALAHGFLNAKDPGGLVVCRLTREQWPAALTSYVFQHYIPSTK